ncbi:MAG: hypothetical protein ACLTS6_12235 [Anaerobutyricum sp.]
MPVSITIDKRGLCESISCVQYVPSGDPTGGIWSELISNALKFKEKNSRLEESVFLSMEKRDEAGTVGGVPEPAYSNPGFSERSSKHLSKDKITIRVDWTESANLDVLTRGQ